MKKKKLIIIISIVALVILASTISFAAFKFINVPKYEVYFESAGGSKVESQYIKKNKVAEKPNNPEKVGFDFIGWYLNDEIYNFDSIVTNNIKLTAKWESNGSTTIYTIKFDCDGGSEIADIQVSEGFEITEPQELVKENYVFVGWYLGETKFDFNFQIYEDITLKAKWIEQNNTEEIEKYKNQTTGSTVVTTTQGEEQKEINIAEEYSKLSGKWYLKGYETVYINFYGGVINGNIRYFVEWMHIDFIGNNTLFPEYGITDSMYIEEFLRNYNYSVNGQDLNVKGLSFSRQSTSLDTSKYDSYIGKWYLPGYGSETYVEIRKEGDTYRIKSSNYDVIAEKYSEGYSNEYIGQCITEMEMYNKRTVFDNYHISESSGTLYVGSGANIKSFSKTPTTTIHNVTGISLEKTSVTLQRDTSSIYLKYSIEPKNATNTAVTWKSSNENIAWVDSNGNIYICGIGTTKITIATVDGNHTANCDITVKPVPVESVSLDKFNVDMKIGEEKGINATLTPNICQGDYIITYSSENNAVATINQYGVIKATGEGTTKINAKAGDKIATCTVNVSRIYLNGISMSNSLDLKYKKTNKLSVTYEPSNATNKGVTWSSSDNNIAIVDQDGNVTAINVGNATITATSKDGGHISTCSVTVTYEQMQIRTSLGYSILVGSNFYKGITGDITNVTGGTGNYVYYNIKGYFNGKYIGESDTKQFKFNSSENGTYRIDVTVKDSAGNIATYTDETNFSSNF